MTIQVIPLIIVVAYLIGMLVIGAVVSKLKIKGNTAQKKCAGNTFS